MTKPSIMIVMDKYRGLDLDEIFELEEYPVFGIADTGVEALELLDSNASLPDLIISDFMMPEMNGVTFLKHLQSSSRYQDIPFMMITPASPDSVKMCAERENAVLPPDHIIHSPFFVEELFELMTKLTIQ